MNGRDLQRKKRPWKERPSIKEIVNNFFHIENGLYFFEVVTNWRKQLVCETPFKWNNLLYYKDWLCEKIIQAKKFPSGRAPQCLRKLINWNKDHAMKRQLVWEKQSNGTNTPNLELGCMWNLIYLSNVVSFQLSSKTLKGTNILNFTKWMLYRG